MRMMISYDMMQENFERNKKTFRRMKREKKPDEADESESGFEDQ